ncbi:MAG: 23S rRNA (adenine(2503)-C(2))-methyltransferase RlmN [Bacilli bacterium]
MKRNLLGIELSKLEKIMVNEYAQKTFRAKQLYKRIYEKKVYNFDEMSDISLLVREIFKNDFCMDLPKIYTKQSSSDGTLKLLLELSDGAKIETVLMRYSYGNSACVSSQVGCNMGCTFCASGLLKKQRDLTVEEMVGQVLVLNKILEEEGNGERVSHVVVMGTGEPFDNYDVVMDFIRIINCPFALQIGARHITVSTCGIPDKIRKYAEEGLQTNLAISLHASTDKVRDQIMTINHKYPLAELMDAVKYYEKTAGRRVTFEYILLENVNDSLDDAYDLKELVKGTFAYINLIPYNAVIENRYKRSSGNRVHSFFDYLMRNNVNTTIRKEFGSDIDAACGQLRAKDLNKL